MFIVTIAYPTLDAILMVPAIVILLDIRNEPLWFIPWICESLGLLLIALSDSWFALVVLTSLTEQFWLSSLFFAASFSCDGSRFSMVYQIYNTPKFAD